jgi:hypothetical protein
MTHISTGASLHPMGIHANKINDLVISSIRSIARSRNPSMLPWRPHLDHFQNLPFRHSLRRSGVSSTKSIHKSLYFSASKASISPTNHERTISRQPGNPHGEAIRLVPLPFLTSHGSHIGRRRLSGFLRTSRTRSRTREGARRRSSGPRRRFWRIIRCC